MERKERNYYIEKIRKFVQRNKKGQLKTKKTVIHFLNTVMGCRECQEINFFGNFRRLTYYYAGDPAKERYYTPFSVVIYFPFENLEIICSRDQSVKIPYIKTLLGKKFEERPITFKWVQSYRHIVQGPQIIVSLASSESIILENGKSLKDSCEPI